MTLSKSRNCKRNYSFLPKTVAIGSLVINSSWCWKCYHCNLWWLLTLTHLLPSSFRPELEAMKYYFWGPYWTIWGPDLVIYGYLGVPNWDPYQSFVDPTTGTFDDLGTLLGHFESLLVNSLISGSTVCWSWALAWLPLAVVAKTADNVDTRSTTFLKPQSINSLSG